MTCVMVKLDIKLFAGVIIMNKLGNDVDQTKNNITVGVKEAVGKITGNEKLELRGKLQSAKALAEWGSTPLKRCIMRQLLTERMYHL